MTENKKVKLPKNLAIQLTENCNLRCKMCYFWGEKGCYSNPESNKKPLILEFDLIKQIVHDLAPAKPSYSFFGGEPLMHPHLEEIIREMKDAGSFLDTPTNGTLLKKHAAMLVQTGFDSIRVSIDGPREVNDSQRGNGSYSKAIEGIEALQQEKQNSGKQTPLISIIYTVTPENCRSIEQFFLKDLDLSAINWITIQMENFITEEMGIAYAEMLRSELGITSEEYWRGFVRSPEYFNKMDTKELARQANKVNKQLKKLGKFTLFLPPTFSPENLKAYLGANWDEMTDKYRSCPVPWVGLDITASGDLAPCHIFYDLVMGNLHEHSFEEIWNGEKYRIFRSYMNQHKLMSICQGCCILYLAGKRIKKQKKIIE